MKKNEKSFVTVLMLTILTCFSSCLFNVKPDDPVRHEKFPRKSFIFVTKVATLSICIKKEEGLQCAPPQKIRLGSGSGFVAGFEKVVTAAHVCGSSSNAFDKLKQILPPETVINLSEEQFEIIDIDGNKFQSVVKKLDIQNDLCLLYVKGLKKPSLKMAKQHLIPGDTVYNMAAPEGIFQKNMVPMFQGIFVGEDTIDISSTQKRYAQMFSLFATGGSSGSVIMNEHMEVISIVTNAYEGRSPIVIGPSFQSMTNFLKDIN